MKIFLNKNKRKKINARTTTALTCLLSTIIIFANTTTPQAATSAATFEATTTIVSTCDTISISTMSFGVYDSATNISATANITFNCSSGTGVQIQLADSYEDTQPYFKLIRSGQAGSSSADYLTVYFKKSDGTYLYSNGNSPNIISATGTGSDLAAGTITGYIDSGQTGRTPGNFRKTVSVNLIY
jgi:spore coat protein U-like protein